MKRYKVYFEIYGKRLKTTVIANNLEDAKQIVKDKIVFHKIDDEDDLFLKKDGLPPDNIDFLKNILGIKD